MKAKISIGQAKGTFVAPPSKSYAHRLLIAAFLSGNGRVENVAFSNDILATLDSLKALGADIKIDKDVVSISKKENRSEVMNANESGSTLRFMIPIALVLNQEAKIKGKEKLFSRGLKVYTDIFDEKGISYELNIDSLFAKGRLLSGTYKIDASISSQFVSGLLFALPLLEGDSEIILNGLVESEPYIDITIDVLKMFDVSVSKNGNVIKIPGNQKYVSKSIRVQGDYSNSSFFEVLNYMGGKVDIIGLDPHSLQGDKAYLECFPLLSKSNQTIDIKNMIDLGPILFAFSSLFYGAKFINISRLRIKESDRVNDTLKILEKFGVKYDLKENSLEIFKSELHTPKEEVETYNDHRLVMMSAILLTKFGGVINGIEAVNKSFPDFFDKLRELGIEVEIYDR